MKIIRPLLGRLTQGCLFTCAQAENYPARNVHGFVITARCDVEQNKYPVLNYLPVVELNDWLVVDGFHALHSRLSAETRASLIQLMRERQLSESLLFSKSFADIGAIFFQTATHNKSHKAQSARYAELLQRWSFLENATYNREAAAADLYRINDKASYSLLRELALQRLLGFYFLPSVDDSNDNRGYVILLREVKHLSRAAASAIANGLDSAEGDEIGEHYGLSFEKETFAMPVGEVSSPGVEHILQTFSQLFGRIGLHDLPSEYLDTIAKRRPQIGDGS